MCGRAPELVRQTGHPLPDGESSLGLPFNRRATQTRRSWREKEDREYRHAEVCVVLHDSKPFARVNQHAVLCILITWNMCVCVCVCVCVYVCV